MDRGLLIGESLAENGLQLSESHHTKFVMNRVGVRSVVKRARITKHTQLDGVATKRGFIIKDAANNPRKAAWRGVKA
jgi:hypothetical protein